MIDPYRNWIDCIFERWLAEVTRKGIARALQSLSNDYVKRRGRIGSRASVGRGKRAAFALYYGVRHFLVVRESLIALGAPRDIPGPIIDLGCGTGVAGAAWCLHGSGEQRVVGVERDAGMIREAELTYRCLNVKGKLVRCHLSAYRWPKPPLCIIAAFTVNELHERDRERLWHSLEEQASGGSRLLVLEPLALRITPWWQDWVERAERIGGRSDEWHFDVELPEPVRLLGKSAGLSPERLGARALWIC